MMQPVFLCDYFFLFICNQIVFFPVRQVPSVYTYKTTKFSELALIMKNCSASDYRLGYCDSLASLTHFVFIFFKKCLNHIDRDSLHYS